eukprot:6359325-Amphidinium_carterae.2
MKTTNMHMKTCMGRTRQPTMISTHYSCMEYTVSTEHTSASPPEWPPPEWPPPRLTSGVQQA